jgi:ferrous iron transport protein A
VPLHLLPPGAAAKVVGMEAGGPKRRRLLDLGFVPGAVVEVVRRSPFGDPTAYAIKGSVIALRREDAAGILVRGDV